MEEKRIIAYKGFNENLCCREFQYEIGKEYEQSGEIKYCENGFHACKNPFDVLDYYGNFENRYCVVEQFGTISQNIEDTNQASSKIKIIKEISLAELFNAGIEWFNENTDFNSSNYAQIATNDNYAQIGTRGRFTKIAASGIHTKIVSSGEFAKIGSSGEFAKIVSSGNGAKIVSSGNFAIIYSSGNFARICVSCDYAQIESTGKESLIYCAGNNSIVKAKKGSWITLSEWGYSEIMREAFPVCVKTEFVDGERIKADTWYKLINGEFVEQTINK